MCYATCGRVLQCAAASKSHRQQTTMDSLVNTSSFVVVDCDHSLNPLLFWPVAHSQWELASFEACSLASAPRCVAAMRMQPAEFDLLMSRHNHGRWCPDWSSWLKVKLKLVNKSSRLVSWSTSHCWKFIPDAMTASSQWHSTWGNQFCSFFGPSPRNSCMKLKRCHLSVAAKNGEEGKEVAEKPREGISAIQLLRSVLDVDHHRCSWDVCLRRYEVWEANCTSKAIANNVGLVVTSKDTTFLLVDRRVVTFSKHWVPLQKIFLSIAQARTSMPTINNT